MVRKSDQAKCYPAVDCLNYIARRPRAATNISILDILDILDVSLVQPTRILNLSPR